MAKTHGTAALPLPLALTIRLKAMGYLEVTLPNPASLPLFRHLKRRELYVSACASNMPGDTDMVNAEWSGQPVVRISVDRLCDKLEDQIAGPR